MIAFQLELQGKPTSLTYSQINHCLYVLLACLINKWQQTPNTNSVHYQSCVCWMESFEFDMSKSFYVQLLSEVWREGWLREQMVNRREYEVVRPVKLHHRYGRDTKLFGTESQDEVNYRLKLNGKDIEIHLQKNRLLISKDYTETHYTNTGTRVTTPYTQDQNQCYYLGKIVGDSQSATSMSTCHGLSGFIRVAGQEYVIEPLAGTDTGDHIVVKYSNLRRVPLNCGVNECRE
ncbi:zinc metalloproteinase/disintegrin-like [Alosa sapidissima]|uniref:zinc metalloproteinase/disintegrin-like n=1 Tax=Alosa sapidissima TaxID=34773 RepID=UPI001C086F47|nr:zinc metalloproteinase/disintegrin-like [Alosa sapidissima]